MYLRTPKRYTSRRGRRRHNLISLRWLWLYLLTPVVVFIGLKIYENREQIQPEVQQVIDSIVGEAVNSVSTQRAPEPTATPDPSGTLGVANNAWSRGSITEATRLYAEIISAVPNDVTVHYFYTLGLIMQDFDAEAVEAGENTVTANPFAADAWTIRAFALNRNAQYGEAIASALQALELAPESRVAQDSNIAGIRARALAQLGLAYYELGQNDRALSTVEQALELNENSPEALYVRGLITWFVFIDRESALADFVRAYELSPNSHYIGTTIMSLESEIAFATGDNQRYEVAEQIAESILELNPDFPRALQWVGRYYRITVGDPNQAADYLTRCVQANPTFDDCYYQLGRVQMLSEDYTGALDSFETAMNINSEDGYYYYWAAEAHILMSPATGCSQAMTYLQPGYRLALESVDQLLIGSFEASLQGCGSPVRQPDAEVTAEPES